MVVAVVVVGARVVVVAVVVVGAGVVVVVVVVVGATVVVVVAVVVAKEVVVVDVAGEEGTSAATSHVMGRLPSRQRPVRGRFKIRVIASTQARARTPGVSRASLTDPVRHRCPSDSIMTRVSTLTHKDGAGSLEDHDNLNSPRRTQP